MAQLYTFESYHYLAKELCKFKSGKFKIERFSNKELHLTLQNFDQKQEAIILGSIAPPEENLFSFLTLAHTLKKEHCKKVTALLPYLAYSRHDKNEKGKSFIVDLIGKLLKDTGIDRVITFDIHTPLIATLFPIEVKSISTAPLFVNEIRKLPFTNPTIVAPDEGAIYRCKEVAQALNLNMASFAKKRTEKGVSHFDFKGKIGEEVIIIDDILDTGQTLLSCSKKLQGKKIIIMVTHALFTGTEWKRLWKLGVQKIYSTNTVPSLPKEKNIIVLSISQLLAKEKLWKN